MKRFHVHIAVDDLDASIKFYSRLFGQSPSKQQPDYAKWMLDDPRVNFAISARGHAVGVNHFGMQVDSMEELNSLKDLAGAASEETLIEQSGATCCYANSEKHWTMDPQGIAWEHFYTTSDAIIFGADTVGEKGACCIPLANSAISSQSSDASCCISKVDAHKTKCC